MFADGITLYFYLENVSELTKGTTDIIQLDGYKINEQDLKFSVSLSLSLAFK